MDRVVDLGVFQDSSATLAEKISLSEETLSDIPNNTINNIGKALCWLTYRFLEGLYSNEEFLIKSFPIAFEKVTQESNQFFHYRWHCSLITARTYLMIFTGKELRPKLLDGSSLRYEPFTMVNIARLCVLKAIWGIKNNANNESVEAIKLLHSLYPRFVSMIYFNSLPACAGYEIELVARMVRMSIMLLPHVGMEYSGDVYSLQQIAAIEHTEPFYQTIRKLIRN